MKNYAYNYKKVSAAKIRERDLPIVESEEFESGTKSCAFRNSISFKRGNAIVSNRPFGV